MASIKKNFLFSTVLTCANYVFPFLTFPYVSRVLGVERLGQCNFVDSVVTYLMLFATMGIGILGIREIAAAKSDKARLGKTFSELLTLNLLTTVFATICLLLLIFLVPKFAFYRGLLFIGVLKLVSNTFLIEWLYKGMEDFKYITFRSILIRTIYVVAVFIFVRDADDFILYYALTVVMVVANAVVNVAYAHRYVRLDFHGLNLRKYAKPYFMLGAYMLFTSMYTSLNVAILGMLTDDVQVGYYSTATRLFAIILSVFSAFTGVLLPRMSALLSERQYEKFNELLSKSTTLLLDVSVPLIIFTLLMSQQIVLIIAGQGYEGAAMPLRVMSPLIFIIGYEQILVMQAMMPMKYDKAILRNSMIGAAVALSLNAALVSGMQSVGSAVCWLSSELTILLLSQLCLSRAIGLRFPYKALARTFALNLGLVPILLATLYLFSGNIWVQCIVGGSLTVAYAAFIQIKVVKEPVVIALVNSVNIFKRR